MIKYQVRRGNGSLRGRQTQSATSGLLLWERGDGAIHPVKESQPLPALTPVSHAQKHLGTLINLSKGSDLFVCKGPAWTSQWLYTVCIQSQHAFSLWLDMYTDFFLFLSLSFPYSLFCINQFWQLPRGVCLMWIFIIIHSVWRRCGISDTF